MPDPRLKTVIVDDEPLARSTLRRLVAADSDLELVAECASGREAVLAVRAHGPALVLLDVQMPGMDGFAVVETLREDVEEAGNGARLPMFLFATAYDRFALKAFEVHAVDYLLKPFDDERFRDALARAKSRARLERVAGLSGELASLLDAMRGLVGNAPPPGPPRSPERAVERLSITHAGRTELVETSDILWIEAADQYVLIHTAAAEHLLRESIAHLEERLDPARFVRVHRSAIVALPHVRRFDRDPGGTGKVLVGKDVWIPVSRSRTALVRERLV
jgi:two-component system LytT family response regulator